MPRPEELRQQLRHCQDPALEYHLRAALSLAEGDTDRALEWIERSLELKADFSARNTQAVILLQAGQCQRAAALLQELLAESPDHPDLWLNLARAQGSQGLAALGRARQLRPNWDLPRLLELGLLAQAREWNELKERCLELLELEPEQTRARELLLLALRQSKQMPAHPALPALLLASEAYDLFPAALRLWPDHPQLLSQLLRRGQVCDLGLERRLAAMRRDYRFNPTPQPWLSDLALHNQTYEFAMLEDPDEATGLTPDHPAWTLYRDSQATSNSSSGVREFYEANPYPRWTSLPPIQARPPGQVLEELFPGQPLPPMQPFRILVAGCGTGRHVLATARRFLGAETWGLDFSQASLEYARQRVPPQEVRLHHGDLLRLEEVTGLPQSFELIEAVGVLHHLAQPVLGLKALRSRLARGGWMRLGLYSRQARARLKPARVLARAHTGDLRSLRRRLVEELEPPDLEFLAGIRDFYSLSGLRDLLLHPLEHEYNLAELAELLNQCDLRLMGLESDGANFGDDLAAWQRYEDEHPESFLGMYLLWVR